MNTTIVAARLGARPCAPEDKAQGDETAALAGTGWIVGSWVDQAGDCDGDTGIFYSADGSFGTATASGRWTIKGQTLTLTTLETFEEGEDPKRLDLPRRIASTIVASGPRAYSEKAADGKVWRMKKCR